jgi:F-type H+-transporting ATPase subunit b
MRTALRSCLIGFAVLAFCAAPALAQHDTHTDQATHAGQDHAAPHGDDHAHADSGAASHKRALVPSPTDPTLWWEMLWSVVVFVIFFIVLSLVVWPQVLKALKTREQKMHDDLATAERSREEAKSMLNDYEAKLSDAHAEVRKMLDQARADADEARGKLIAEAEAESVRLRQRAGDEIRLAKQQAVQDMYAQAAELATAVAGKLLERQINEEDAQRLVDQSLKELDKAG